MEKYILTRDMLMAAKSYLPLEEKQKILSYADRCFDRLSITSGDEPLPPMWKENAGLKARYLMAALLGYFGIEAEAESEGLITQEVYDYYAGSHIYMQIERFKRDRDEIVKNKAYDLMSDYNQLEKMFNAEIRALLDVQNDTVVRQQLITKDIMQQLPWALQEFKALIEKREGATA